MTKQASFSELEYAAKKKQTRWDRFLAEIEAVTPWAAELERTITPFYPGCCACTWCSNASDSRTKVSRIACQKFCV